ncbi:hypothetical protein [Hydrogenophaga sp. R2]|uniref:hypothetical protein n=1 Tax=Hydrogenophaga sp. R2 TaxID=3132827 RepID=UPI003CFBB022
MEIQRLLSAIARNLSDAGQTSVSDETRFDQSLPLTLGVDNATWVLLDALRRKRNANDYTGDTITRDMVDACIEQGRRLHDRLLAHLDRGHPALLR